ncbi:11-beta-hydroxysteroid dehydrogenase-like 4A [Syzygium oleosum]|uniref:11-beta-hydroxysteroid dehydrogenase-like 4A n=1 Tax=Syzygium oleosum TaxID=219896 RepID=UPI0024B88BBE|nr:11-beta-hydroxysteroid dehydrogenase-like 4A [Syzygium oleosum]
MDLIHKIFNLLLPPLALLALLSWLPLHVAFVLLRLIKRCLMHVEDDVAGKVVLVTGAASGIGEQIAYEYARRGACLSLVDIREEDLEAVAGKARLLGSPDVITIGADVSDDHHSQRFVHRTVDHFGRLDHLINNAGIAKHGLFEDLSHISDYTRVMDVNFWGTVYGTHYAIPHLKKSRGKIAVIASCVGWYPVPGLCFYSASKAAVISFYETLRTEIGDSVGITIVTPGLIKSEMTMPRHSSKGKSRYILVESTERAAKAIVRSACRGDMYLTEPFWTSVFYPWKVLFPQVTEWCNRWIYITLPRASRSAGA